MGVSIIYKDTEVTVLAERIVDPSLSDFSLQDWQEWLVGEVVNLSWFWLLL